MFEAQGNIQWKHFPNMLVRISILYQSTFFYFKYFEDERSFYIVLVIGWSFFLYAHDFIIDIYIKRREMATKRMNGTTYET